MKQAIGHFWCLLLIWVQTLVFTNYSFATNTTITKSSQDQLANLELTRFLFTQVFQSYVEDGDQFVIQSVLGNGHQSYEFLLEKKFILAFLRAWEQILAKPSHPYTKSLEIFKEICSQPGFFKDNCFYLKKLLGINEQFSEYNQLSPSNPFKAISQSIFSAPTSRGYTPGLTPFEQYRLEIGYRRDAQLISFLNSENEKDLTKRSLKTLDDLSFFMAGPKDDRKTQLWTLSFFLNHPELEVKIKAEKILANIDFNEYTDLASELRWWVLGGRAGLKYLSMLGSKLLVLVRKVPGLKAIADWLKMRTDRVLQWGILAKDKAKLAYLSVYRYIKFLDEGVVISAGVSISAHWLFYQKFIKLKADSNSEVKNQEPSLQLINEIQLTLNDLDMSEESQIFLKTHFNSLMIFNPQVRQYFSDPEYRKLQDYNPTPLEILNSPIPFALTNESQFKNELQKHLTADTVNAQVPFGQYFLQDEYQRTISDTRANDLRIPSLANKVIEVRQMKITEILQNLKIQKLSEATTDQMSTALTAIHRYLLPNHLYYYIRDSRSYSREVLGEGGNCVAIAMLQLSLLSRFLENGEWKMGVKFEPNHMFVIVYNSYGLHFRLDTLEKVSTDELHSYSLMYDPKIFLAFMLGAKATAEFMTNSQYIHPRFSWQPYGEAPTPDQNELANIGELLQHGSADWLDNIKNRLRALMNNPIKFDFQLKDSKDEPIPEFKIVKDIQNSAETPQTTGAKFSDWREGLNIKIQKISANPPKPSAKTNFEETKINDDELAAKRSGNSFGFAGDKLTTNPVFYGNPIQISSGSFEPYFIPILKGKLGSFYWANPERGFYSTRGIPAFDALREKQLGLFLFANQVQTQILSQFEPIEFLKLMLISLYDYGQQLATNNLQMQQKLKQFLIHDVHKVTTPLLATHPLVLELNQDLLKNYLYHLTLDALHSNTAQFCQGSPESDAEKQPCIHIIRFLEKIGMPDRWMQTDISGNISTAPVPFLPFFPSLVPLEDNPLIITQLQHLLTQNKFASSAGAKTKIISTSYETFNRFNTYSVLTQKLGFQSQDKTLTPGYDLNLIQFANGAFATKKVLIPFQKGKPYAHIYENYEDIEPSDSDGKLCVLGKNLSDEKKLHVLADTPTESLRAQFLLPLLELPELQCHTQHVANQFRTLLRDTDVTWQIQLPTIKVKKCKHTGIKVPENIQLPQLSQELCQDLPSSGREGTICVKANKQGVDGRPQPNEIEICQDSRSHFNFEVLRAKTNSASNTEIQIPFENLLSLYADPYTQPDFKKLLPGHLSERLKQRWFLPEQHTIAPDSLMPHIQGKVIEHLKNYWPYYSLYWKSEVQNLCVDIFADHDFSQTLKTELQNHRICP